MTQRAEKKFTSLTTCNALNQAKISIILMAVIPSLSLFYLGTRVGSQDNAFTFLTLFIIVVLTVAIAVPGFFILRKYPANIVKLRQYITEIAQGTLPDKIQLTDTESSNDLKYIEESFNSVLDELRHRIAMAEERLRTELSLRETIEHQQQTLLDAERHRVMIQTLGAACHHIGQPATVLQIRLSLLQKLAIREDENQEIKECIKAVQLISDILHQLQRVSEFRTVPYAQTGTGNEEAILAIGSES
jgi:signal transduction histidine kinase